MRLVVDASMALAWVLDDERSEAAEDILRRVVVEGATVPAHWPLEVANALHFAARRGRCSNEHVDRSLERLGELAIVIDPETNDRAWNATLAMAREEGLTVYDAAYLEIAIRRSSSLATHDRRLADAARRRGVDVVPS